MEVHGAHCTWLARPRHHRFCIVKAAFLPSFARSSLSIHIYFMRTFDCIAAQRHTCFVLCCVGSTIMLRWFKGCGETKQGKKSGYTCERGRRIDDPHPTLSWWCWRYRTFLVVRYSRIHHHFFAQEFCPPQTVSANAASLVNYDLCIIQVSTRQNHAPWAPGGRFNSIEKGLNKF